LVRRSWPPWWEWELLLTKHVLKRMHDRDFSEIDLRMMLERALALERAKEPGRWQVLARHGGVLWGIVVEPEYDTRLLAVITAFPLD
jgi:hypothetical protein